MPKRFPPEYRTRVLALLHAGGSLQDVAADLGISQATIYGWRKQHQIDNGLRPGVGTEHSGELAAARRRIRELEEQVAILQHAADTWREVVRPKDRFALIADLAAKGLSVKRATSVLGVTDSGYYALAGAGAFRPVDSSRDAHRCHPSGTRCLTTDLRRPAHPC